MKKITILMASILAMVGCAKNTEIGNEISRNRVEMNISAVKDVAEVSRVAFNGGVTDMIWEADDQIGVHIASTGETATFSVLELSEDSQIARFRGEIYEPEAVDSYYAFYPSNSGINGTNVYFILPSETTGATTPYLVASHENAERHFVEMTFRPVTALLELTLGFAADKVVVESINGEALSGVLTFNCADGSTIQPTGSSSITLTPNAAGTYYLHIPETTLAKGYKVTVTVGDQQMIKTVSYGKEKKFEAGVVTPLSIPTFEGVTVNMCNVYTSYSLYKQGNTDANSTNGNSIFFDGNCSFSGVSSTLVKECGVNCAGTTLKGTASNKQFSVSSLTDMNQGAYEVYAYIKLQDGTTYKSASQTVYVTGLPYSIIFGNTTEPAGWTVNNTKIGKTLTHSFNIFSFGAGDAYAISPKFYIPANDSANVTATFKMYAYTSVANKFKPSIYISASESAVKNNLVTTLTSQITTYDAMVGDWSYPAATVSLTSGAGKVCLYTSGSCSSFYYPCIPTETCTIYYAF